jgi:hypothetical protein
MPLANAHARAASGTLSFQRCVPLPPYGLILSFVPWNDRIGTG